MGGAVITGAGRLPPPARYILHAVGPSYSLREDKECARLFRRAHTESLRLAEENGIQSVAFPAIGGEGGYPIRKAAPIAFSVAVDHLATNATSVNLIVFVVQTPTDLMAFAAALASIAATLPGRPRD